MLLQWLNVTAGLTLVPAPAVATVRQESRSAPAPAVATVPQPGAFSASSSPVVCSHKGAADYLTFVSQLAKQTHCLVYVEVHNNKTIKTKMFYNLKWRQYFYTVPVYYLFEAFQLWFWFLVCWYRWYNGGLICSNARARIKCQRTKTLSNKENNSNRLQNRKKKP